MQMNFLLFQAIAISEHNCLFNTNLTIWDLNINMYNTNVPIVGHNAKNQAVSILTSEIVSNAEGKHRAAAAHAAFVICAMEQLGLLDFVRLHQIYAVVLFVTTIVWAERHDTYSASIEECLGIELLKAHLQHFNAELRTKRDM